MEFVKRLFSRRYASVTESPKTSAPIPTPPASPIPAISDEDTNFPGESIPGAFPPSPPKSPGLKPIDSQGDTFGQADTAPQDWQFPNQDGHMQNEIVTDLGPHLRPHWPVGLSRPPTPKRSPPPSTPKAERVPKNRTEIVDPWVQHAHEFAKTTRGRVSAVQLFRAKQTSIPENRTKSWYAADFERLEKERLARELDGQRPSRVVPSGQPVRSLSQKWASKVREAERCKQSQVVATTLAGHEICQKDIITCVRPMAWLNDEIINSYLAILVHYLRQLNGNLGPNDRPRFHSFNTFFYSNLRDKGYQSVARWATRAKIGRENLLDVDTVFIPVHEVNHWTLMVVRPVDRTIEYFDSLGSAGAYQVKSIKAWLRGELGPKYKEEEWTVLKSVSSRQDNMSDCGVFLLINAKAIALGIEPTAFGPSHTTLLRSKIVAEIMNGGLHGEFIPKDPTGTLLL
ncbi:unnamed protein product [Penicillium olsonii]|uniref:Ubiquitin-like protease family profile domain-containing protein n=1 Tax=Penicillium olsonii TaxID=99116 RepID=A0A9W4HVP5_PENOL|nr:unnamed protein product [Penicillium olsonii]CAG8137783.1 unnamed protein product [Penicillium olsonii]CAG8139336.1 unnamed protein product [Penicillium olsonii]